MTKSWHIKFTYIYQVMYGDKIPVRDIFSMISQSPSQIDPTVLLEDSFYNVTVICRNQSVMY